MSKIVSKEYVSYLARAGIVLAVLFGTAVTLWSSQFTDIRRSAGLGLYGGAVFGVAVTALLAVLDYVSKRRLLRIYGRVSHRVRQTRVIQLNDSPEAAFARSRAAMRHMGVNLSAADVERGLLTGTIRGSIRSFGEKLTVHIEPDGRGGATVSVESRPRGALTLIDYGKNLDNIEMFSALLKSNGITDALAR